MAPVEDDNAVAAGDEGVLELVAVAVVEVMQMGSDSDSGFQVLEPGFAGRISSARKK